ncbi:MAG: hypothetical protein QOE90_2317 [Thermoplasmata archaeon]|nr:hypothetical protein [Thermoplasmata archaeon]
MTAPLLLALLAAPASAASPGLILAMDTGTTDVPNSLAAAGIPACSASTGPYCFDLVKPSLVTPATFGGRQVIYVGWSASSLSSELTALNAKAAWIDAFVSGGGGLVVSSQSSQGAAAYAFAPQGSSFSIVAVNAEDVTLTDPGHPIMTGQTTATLSNWGNSYHNYFVSWPAYLTHTLAVNNKNESIDRAGNYGAGCVFVSGSDIDFHATYGNPSAVNLVKYGVDWASRCGCEAGDPCSPALAVSGRAAILSPDGTVDPAVTLGGDGDHAESLVAVDLCTGTIDSDNLLGPDPTGLGSLLGGLTGLIGPAAVNACVLTPAETGLPTAVPAVGISLYPTDPAYPSYVGTVHIALKPCQCTIERVSWTYSTSHDVPPLNDGIGPMVSQPAANQWDVKSVDGDAYLVTFSVAMKCPEGEKTLSTTFYVR